MEKIRIPSEDASWGEIQAMKYFEEHGHGYGMDGKVLNNPTIQDLHSGVRMRRQLSDIHMPVVHFDWEGRNVSKWRVGRTTCTLHKGEVFNPFLLEKKGKKKVFRSRVPDGYVFNALDLPKETGKKLGYTEEKQVEKDSHKEDDE